MKTWCPSIIWKPGDRPGVPRVSGELLFQCGDEFVKRFPVRGLPLDEDEEAVLVEEDRGGGRLPALHHIQRHGGRGQLVDARVELPGTIVRRRANAFDGGPV